MARLTLSPEELTEALRPGTPLPLIYVTVRETGEVTYILDIREWHGCYSIRCANGEGYLMDAATLDDEFGLRWRAYVPRLRQELQRNSNSEERMFIAQ